MSTASPAPDGQRRAVIAAAVVFALLALVGLAVLLVTGDDDDRLATPTATPTASPSPSPSAEPSPSATPSPSPSPSAEPSPEPAAWEVAEALLTPQAATAATGDDWAPADYSADPEPLLDPCGDGEVPLADRVAASEEQALAYEREAGGGELLQEVVRYETEQDAAEAFGTHLERVQACPRVEFDEPEGHAQELSVVADASGPDRLLVRQRYCNPACTDLYTTYALVARTGSGVTVARFAIAADGDPEQDARPLLDVVAEQLAAAVG